MNFTQKGNGISCKIQHYKLWRRVLKERYPEAIVGKQRRNSSSGLKQSLDPGVKGVRFILRFRLKGVEDTYFKAADMQAMLDLDFVSTSNRDVCP